MNLKYTLPSGVIVYSDYSPHHQYLPKAKVTSVSCKTEETSSPIMNSSKDTINMVSLIGHLINPQNQIQTPHFSKQSWQMEAK